MCCSCGGGDEDNYQLIFDVTDPSMTVTVYEIPITIQHVTYTDIKVEDIFAINVTSCVLTGVSIPTADKITPDADDFIFGQSAIQYQAPTPEQSPACGYDITDVEFLNFTNLLSYDLRTSYITMSGDSDPDGATTQDVFATLTMSDDNSATW